MPNLRWKTVTEKFSVEPKRVRKWRENFEKTISAKSSKQRQRPEGGGWKCFGSDLREKLSAWVYEQLGKMLHVNRKMIIFERKNMFYNESEDPAVRETYVASRGWCEKFMTRHEFSLRRKTTIAHRSSHRR